MGFPVKVVSSPNGSLGSAVAVVARAPGAAVSCRRELAGGLCYLLLLGTTVFATTARFR